MNNLRKFLALTLLLSTVTACMFHGGEPQHISTITLGRELTELKAAFDSGAISESEYQTIKARLLDESHSR